jgi:hypothetical protein
MSQEEDEVTKFTVSYDGKTSNLEAYTSTSNPYDALRNYITSDDTPAARPPTLQTILTEAPSPPLCDLQFAEEYIKWLKKLKSL